MDIILISFHNMVYSQSFENRTNKSAAVRGLPIFYKACPLILTHFLTEETKKWHQIGIEPGVNEFFGLISSICVENICLTI